MNKVYCRYCGKQIDEDAIFCTHCGKEQGVSNSSLRIINGQRGSSKTVSHNVRTLIRIPLDLLKSIKIPRMSEEHEFIWQKRMKRVIKIIFSVAVVAIILVASAWCYSYYYDDYLPQKQLDEACTDVINKLHSTDTSISYDCCLNILQKYTSWGYENVADDSISDRMDKYIYEAFRILESRAMSGDPEVQYTLGFFYYKNGDYITNDTVKAMYWWNEAAKQDYTPAFNFLGKAYENGEGVKQDKKKAVQYYRMGAEKGDAYAQANYGRLFRDGVLIKVGSHEEIVSTTGYRWDGQKIRSYYDSSKNDFVNVYKINVDDYDWLIPKDLEQAKYWWQKAVEQGNQYAKDMLQKVYD